MPVISNEDFAAFQAWKAQGGAAPQAPAQRPPTPTVGPPLPPAGAPPLKTWDPQKGWQGGPAPGSGPPDASGINRDGLPGPGPNGDYTAQNEEIARRFAAAKADPNSPLYVSPEQQAQRDQADALLAQYNPGWSNKKEVNGVDDAWRWVGQGPQKPFDSSGPAAANPRLFGIEGLYGSGGTSPNYVEDPATGAMRQKTPEEWEAGKAPTLGANGGPKNYGGNDPNAPPSGWERGPDGQLRPVSISSTPAEPTGVVGGGHRPIVRNPAPPPPSAAGIGREGAPRPASPPAPTGVVGGGHRPIVRSPSPGLQPPPQGISQLGGVFDDPSINPPPPKPTMPGAFRPPRVNFRGGY